MRLPPPGEALQLVWTSLSIPHLFTLQDRDQHQPNTSLRKWVNTWQVCPCPSNCSPSVSDSQEKYMKGWMFPP